MADLPPTRTSRAVDIEVALEGMGSAAAARGAVLFVNAAKLDQELECAHQMIIENARLISYIWAISRVESAGPIPQSR